MGEGGERKRQEKRKETRRKWIRSEKKERQIYDEHAFIYFTTQQMYKSLKVCLASPSCL